MHHRALSPHFGRPPSPAPSREGASEAASCAWRVATPPEVRKAFRVELAGEESARLLGIRPVFRARARTVPAREAVAKNVAFRPEIQGGLWNEGCGTLASKFPLGETAIARGAKNVAIRPETWNCPA